MSLRFNREAFIETAFMLFRWGKTKERNLFKPFLYIMGVVGLPFSVFIGLLAAIEY